MSKAALFVGDDGRYKIPAPILLALIGPIVILTWFYVFYAQNAWFCQDDFDFISKYSVSVEWRQLYDFSDFVRFLSRNVYWHFCLKWFSHNAQYFYLTNFSIILATGFLIYAIFRREYGRFEGLIAGLLYLMLPATIESYVWISNSQHIIGHFFVALFVYVFVSNRGDTDKASEIFRAIALSIILVLGILSNIFVIMVLSLPAWMLLIDRRTWRAKSIYALLIFGVMLFIFFFHKLAANQTGAYSTSYTPKVVIDNAEYYAGGKARAVFWFILVGLGGIYAALKNKYMTSWFFLASFAFFIPFAFFSVSYHRYGQYGELSNLFFLLAVWSFLIEFIGVRGAYFVGYAGLVMVFSVFFHALEPSVRYFSESPMGAAQKKQIDYLKEYEVLHPEKAKYCFRSDKKVNNATGVKEWDIPAEWWALDFGKALTLFANPDKTYNLLQSSADCDVVFVFKDNMLVDAGGQQ